MSALLSVAVGIAAVLLCVGLLCALLRLAHGPTLADRALALDLLGILSIGVAALALVAGAGSAALDVALVTALASGIGSIAFARHLQQGDDVS